MQEQLTPQATRNDPNLTNSESNPVLRPIWRARGKKIVVAIISEGANGCAITPGKPRISTPENEVTVCLGYSSRSCRTLYVDMSFRISCTKNGVLRKASGVHKLGRAYVTVSAARSMSRGILHT